MTTDEKLFWLVVEACIYAFHKEYSADALERMKELQEWLEGEEEETADLFYHAEPFHVACDLAKNDLKVEDYFNEYLRIRESYFL